MNQHRYFQSASHVLHVSKVVEGTVSSTMNTHILTNPANIDSAPTAGWTEVTEAQFRTLHDQKRADVEATRVSDATAATEARSDAYDEAITLGFSPAAATAITGHTP